MRQGQIATTALALLLSLPAAAAAEDLTIVSRVTPPQGAAPTTSTQYVSGSKLRTSDGTSDTILDVASGSMLFVEHQQKRYYETSLDEIRARVDAAAQNLDPEAMSELFGGIDSVAVLKDAETRQIAGYTCQRYNLSFGPFLVFEVWVTPDLQPPPGYFEGRKLHYVSVGPFAERFEKMVDAMKRIGGLPLATTIHTNIMGLSMHSETEATEVKEGPIPPETFKPPAGYAKMESPYRKN